MNFIIKIIISAISVMLTAWFLPGVTVNGFVAAMIVAGVLGLLNTFVKPVLQLLTIPVTMITFGLFLIVINAILVQVADYFIADFNVKGWIAAALFSIINSVIMYVLESFFGSKKD
jgi:putative membrane protein